MAAAVDDDRSGRLGGLGYGVGAYGLWAFAPIFWRQLQSVDSSLQLGHRILWASLCFVLLVAGRKQIGLTVATLRNSRSVIPLFATAGLLAANWFTFMYAVETDRVVVASLGYFINPLISVMLGMVFLSERLTRIQWAAVAMASIGVAQLIAAAQPGLWISFVLAFSFGLYGLVRKRSAIPPLVGSAIESFLMLPIAGAYLIWLSANGEDILQGGGATMWVLFVATGPVTLIPLLLFANAAKLLPLSTLGFVQYLAPTGQFVLAVMLFDEPFSEEQLARFSWIWAGIAVFALERAYASHRDSRRRKLPAVDV